MIVNGNLYINNIIEFSTKFKIGFVKKHNYGLVYSTGLGTCTV